MSHRGAATETEDGLSRETLRTFMLVSGLNALLTLAYPAAMVSFVFFEELSSALRLLAVLSLVLAGVGCSTILGLRRYLAEDHGFDGASGALAVHAGVTAASGVALLVGWGVLRLGSSESELSWALGLGVLGFFLLVSVAVGLLELLIAGALGRCSADGFGLLGPVRVTFWVVGVANLVSTIVGFTIVVGMTAYAVAFGLVFLLFHAAWRARAGLLPGDFRYGRGAVAAVVAVALLSLALPGAAAVQALRGFVAEASEDADSTDADESEATDADGGSPR